MKLAYMAMREKKIKISQLSNRVAAIWIISQLQTGYRFCGKSYLSPDYLGVLFLVKNQVTAAYRFISSMQHIEFYEIIAYINFIPATYLIFVSCVKPWGPQK